MELLNKHVSIRKFKEKNIEDQLLEEILYSGSRASTTGNMQVYSIVVTKDMKRKESLAPYHFNQPVVKSAPVLLTFLADFNRFSLWCEQNSAEPGYNNFISFITASIDALLVAQNVCIAAEEKGLGVCYLGTTTYNAAEIIKEFKLPKLTFPITTVALGYPDESPELVDRIPLKGIVHAEEYKDYTADEIHELYAFKESLATSKQFIKENDKQTLAQVFTDIRYKKSDNEFFSEKMLRVIKDQGFDF
jgi:nitroreductase